MSVGPEGMAVSLKGIKVMWNKKEVSRLAVTTREWLKKATLTKEMVDRFLDPDARNIWAFDAELGFGVRSCIRNDGVDQSQTVNHVDPSGEPTHRIHAVPSLALAFIYD